MITSFRYWSVSFKKNGIIGLIKSHVFQNKTMLALLMSQLAVLCSDVLGYGNGSNQSLDQRGKVGFGATLKKQGQRQRFLFGKI